MSEVTLQSCIANAEKQLVAVFDRVNMYNGTAVKSDTSNGVKANLGIGTMLDQLTKVRDCLTILCEIKALASKLEESKCTTSP